METVKQRQLKAYHGNCHCGANRFEVQIPETVESAVIACGCSLCSKQGYLWASYPTTGSYRITRGDSANTLTTYESASLVHQVGCNV